MADYKIKDVEVLTGVKAHTIRIWEKRYGILVPERTVSQIRTYSEEDLMLLLNISILNQNGLKISKIAKLSNEELKTQVRKISFSKDSESAVLSLLINALIDFDEALFKRVVNSIIGKEGLRSAYFNYVLPFLDRIGVMWLVGTISPAQEHFISNLIRETLIVETNKLSEPKSDYKYVLFCREGEWHELSLLLYNYLLREKGARTLYLGQNLPLDGLNEIIHKIKTDALVSSLIAPLDEKSIKDFSRLVDSIGVPIYLGGIQSEVMLNSLKNHPTLKSIDELFV